MAHAETKFQQPSHEWFDEAQRALRGEVERISRAMVSQSKSDAIVWKSHLRWELLERNLGPLDTVRLDELRLVRRWMFSNRQGLESPFFARLRTLTDQYIDAVFTLQQPDLRAAFVEKVRQTRAACVRVLDDPSDSHAAALGRELGWFDQTGQISEEVAALRSLLSLPNAQVVVADSLIARILATEVTEVSETIPVADVVTAPSNGPLGRRRTMHVRGSASTRGAVTLAPTPNEQVAELALKFDGTVHSSIVGQTGPVAIRMAVTGSAEAVKPLYLSPSGLELGETSVSPSVHPRVTGVSADSQLIERLARRRAFAPESRTLMNRRAHAATIEQLQTQLDQRVAEAIDKIETDASRVQASLQDFQEVVAPLEREGATPRLAGLRSTAATIQLNAFAEQRGQFGAAAPCPHDGIAGDIQLRLHVSAFNNMAETITGGKTLDDKFLMKYAKVLHAELPLPLMVHSRATRWAFTMCRHRPIEMLIPTVNHFTFVVRIDAVEIDGRTHAEPAVVTIPYQLRQDDLGEYALVRLREIELETEASAKVRAIVYEKMNAFFGPRIDGGGMIIPEGGVLAPLRRLQSRGIHAEREWITIALDVPNEAIEEFLRFQRHKAEPAVAAAAAGPANAAG